MQKDLNEKRSCKIIRNLEPCHVASKSCSFQVFQSRPPRSQNVTGVIKMNRVQSYCSKTADENEENIIKLNVSPNRKNILVKKKLFASTQMQNQRWQRPNPANFDFRSLEASSGLLLFLKLLCVHSLMLHFCVQNENVRSWMQWRALHLSLDLCLFVSFF